MNPDEKPPHLNGRDGIDRTGILPFKNNTGIEEQAYYLQRRFPELFKMIIDKDPGSGRILFDEPYRSAFLAATGELAVQFVRDLSGQTNIDMDDDEIIRDTAFLWTMLLYSMARWIACGRRILKPSCGLCDRFMVTDVRVPIRYVQPPFDCVYIDLSQSKFGSMRLGTKGLEGVMVLQEPAERLSDIFVGEDIIRALHYLWHAEHSYHADWKVIWRHFPTVVSKENEDAIAADLLSKYNAENPGSNVEAITNLIYNIFLYISQPGCHVQQKETKGVGKIPDHMRSKRRRANLERRASQQKIEYILGQQIRLDGFHLPSGPDDGTGSEKCPHWRRGHWRMQWRGSTDFDNREQVPRWIRPVLVRRDIVATGADGGRGIYAVTEKRLEKKTD